MKKFHYAWVVVGVTFLALLASSGVRNAPSVMIKPLETEFGWDRGSISFAVAISLFAFGFGAPLGGSLINRFGARRVMMSGLVLVVLGLLPMINMTTLSEYQLFWGLVVGIGTGVVTNVLGSAIALRWFNQYRGVVLGLLGAATATGQLLLLPVLIWMASANGWRSVVLFLAVVVGIVIVPVFLFLRNRPDDIGQKPLGEVSLANASNDERFTPLGEALRNRNFWLLAGSFFICGYTTNGMIGTHLLPHAMEHGFVEAEMSLALAFMGAMNIVGTMASGWLSDRYDNRMLLGLYYGFRALALMALPFILEMQGMFLFSLIYGLDWVATVPPTVNLTAQHFGRLSVGTLYGWIFCSHMIGAGIASYAGGVFRDVLGDYHLIFISAALMGIVACALALNISPVRKVKTT